MFSGVISFLVFYYSRFSFNLKAVKKILKVKNLDKLKALNLFQRFMLCCKIKSDKNHKNLLDKGLLLYEKRANFMSVYNKLNDLLKKAYSDFTEGHLTLSDDEGAIAKVEIEPPN